MFRAITTLTFGLGLIGSLALARPVSADEKVDASGSAKGGVQLVFLDPLTGIGVQAWSAEAVDTSDVEVIGDHTITGVTFFDTVNGTASGTFHAVSTEYPGTTISGSFSGEIAPIADGGIELFLTVLWEAGTGRAAGVSGTADAEGSQGAYAPDGSAPHE